MNTQITSSLIDMTIATLLVKLLNINKIINKTEITLLISEIQTNLCTDTLEQSIELLNLINAHYNNEDINNLINVINKIKYSV